MCFAEFLVALQSDDVPGAAGTDGAGVPRPRPGAAPTGRICAIFYSALASSVRASFKNTPEKRRRAGRRRIVLHKKSGEKPKRRKSRNNIRHFGEFAKNRRNSQKKNVDRPENMVQSPMENGGRAPGEKGIFKEAHYDSTVRSRRLSGKRRSYGQCVRRPGGGQEGDHGLEDPAGAQYVRRSRAAQGEV